MFDHQFTAAIQLQGPIGLDVVRQKIQTGLSSIRVPIGLDLSQSSVSTFRQRLATGLGSIHVPVDVAVSPRSLSAIRQQLSVGFPPINLSLNVSSINAGRGAVRGLTGDLRSLTSAVRGTSAAFRGLSLPPGFLAVAGSINAIALATSSLTANLRAMAAQMANLQAQARQAVTNVNAANAAPVSRNVQGGAGGIVGSFGRTLTTSLSTRAIYGIAGAIREGLSEALQFEKQLVAIRQTAGGTSEAVSGLGGEIQKLSAGLGVSSIELVGAAKSLAQAGNSIQQTQELLQSVARSSLSPSFKNTEETVKGVIAAMQVFGVSARDVEKSLGGISAVASGFAGNFAVGAGDLIETLSRAGASAVAAKTDMGQFLGIFTSVRGVTRESAASVSTALKSIFSRIQRPEIIQQLQDLGIELRYTARDAERIGDLKLNQRFVGGDEALRRISVGLKGLRTTDVRYSQAIEAIGGSRNVGRVLPAIQRRDVAEQAKRVFDSGAQSLQRDADIASDSLLVKGARVSEQFGNIFKNLVTDKGFQSLASGALRLAAGLTAIADATRPLIPLLAGLSVYGLGRSAASHFVSPLPLGPVPPAGIVGNLRYQRQQAILAHPRAQLATAGVALGATFLGSALHDSAGPAETGGSRFVGTRGVSGAISGAGVGALVGSQILPGYGTAIGAVIGGLAGMSAALREASDDIQSARIGASLTSFSDKLTTLVAGGSGASALALKNLTDLDRENTAKNARESSGFFSGFDPATFAALQSKTERINLLPTLPNVSQYLSKESENLAKSRPDEAAQNLVAELQRGGGGLNSELINLTARLRGVDLATVLQELAKAIHSSQQAILNQKQGKQAEEAEEKSLSSLGLMTQAFQEASDSVHRFRDRTRLANEGFHGTYGPSQVSAHTDALQHFGRGDGSSLRPVRLVSGYGGGHSSLLNDSAALDDVSRVLPSILAHVASRAPSSGDDFGSEVRSEIVDTLKRLEKPISSSVEGILDTIQKEISRLSKESIGDVVDSIATDAVGLSHQLLAPRANPIQNHVGRAASLIQEQANQYSDGLGQVSRNRFAIGETQDLANHLSLQADRQRLIHVARQDFRAESLTSQIPLSVLNGPVAQRESRLLGGRADLAGNPQAIGRELVSLQEQIQRATTDQQTAFASGKPQDFLRSANALNQLTEKATGFRQALSEMTDVSKKNAAAIEKVTQLEGDRQGRFSLAEKFATADPSEQFKLQKYVALSRVVATTPKAFDFLRPEDRQGVLGLAQAAGPATFPFFNGRSGHEFRELALSNFAGGAFKQPAALQQARQQAEAQIDKNNSNGATAASVLASTQTRINNELLEGMKGTFGTFLSQLALVLDRNKVVELTNKLGSTSREVGNLETLDKHRKILNQAGIGDDAALGRLGSHISDVVEAANQRKQITDLRNAKQGISPETTSSFFDKALTPSINSDAKRGWFDVPLKADDASVLAEIQKAIGSKLGPDSQDVAANATAKFRDQLASQLTGSAKGLRLEDVAKQRGTVERVLGESTRSALEEKASGIQLGPLADVQARLRKQNLDPYKLRSVDSDELKLALKAFQESTSTLEGLDQQIQKTRDLFESLNKQIQQLSIKPGEQREAQGFSNGGPVFQPRGTDRIPAMLSPREFVVNSRSAVSNASLLRKINRAKGPVYLAEGGSADDSFKGGGFDGPPKYVPPTPPHDKFLDTQLQPEQRFVKGGKLKSREELEKFRQDLFDQMEELNKGETFFNNRVGRYTIPPNAEKRLKARELFLRHQEAEKALSSLPPEKEMVRRRPRTFAEFQDQQNSGKYKDFGIGQALPPVARALDEPPPVNRIPAKTYAEFAARKSKGEFGDVKVGVLGIRPSDSPVPPSLPLPTDRFGNEIAPGFHFPTIRRENFGKKIRERLDRRDALKLAQSEARKQREAKAAAPPTPQPPVVPQAPLGPVVVPPMPVPRVADPSLPGETPHDRGERLSREARARLRDPNQNRKTFPADNPTTPETPHDRSERLNREARARLRDPNHKRFPVNVDADDDDNRRVNPDEETGDLFSRLGLDHAVVRPQDKAQHAQIQAERARTGLAQFGGALLYAKLVREHASPNELRRHLYNLGEVKRRFKKDRNDSGAYHYLAHLAQIQANAHQANALSLFHRRANLANRVDVGTPFGTGRAGFQEHLNQGQRSLAFLQSEHTKFGEPIHFRGLPGIDNRKTAIRGHTPDFKVYPHYDSGGLIPGPSRGDDRLIAVGGGESVLNAQATRSLGANGVQQLNRGGNNPGAGGANDIAKAVSQMNSSFSGFGQSVSTLKTALQGFDKSAQTFSSAITRLSGSVASLEKIVAGIPSEVKTTHGPVTHFVNHVGPSSQGQSGLSDEQIAQTAKIARQQGVNLLKEYMAGGGPYS